MTPTDLLAFESRPWRTAGAKEQAIATEFGHTPVQHYQRLLHALQDPEAVAAHPVTAARLRRLTRSPIRARARWTS